MKNGFFILVCVFVAFKAAAQTVRSDSMEYSSVKLEKDDKVFLALKDTAQKYLQVFISGVNKHGREAKNYRFLIKSDFVQNGHHEHMWSRIYEYKNGIFKGTFIDSAFTVKNIKMGNKVAINRNAIEDWAIDNLISGQTSGGFSNKYLENKMKKRED